MPWEREITATIISVVYRNSPLLLWFAIFSPRTSLPEKIGESHWPARFYLPRRSPSTPEADYIIEDALTRLGADTVSSGLTHSARRATTFRCPTTLSDSIGSSLTTHNDPLRSTSSAREPETKTSGKYTPLFDDLADLFPFDWSSQGTFHIHY